MEFVMLGRPADGPKLELDWRRFSYAGKFVMTNTGKAVIKRDGAIVAAIAFNEDRTDDDAVWIRYVTVRDDLRGNGIGPRLIDETATRLLDRYSSIRTGANNPYSYEGFYNAGFGFTGETTGLEELVLERPMDDAADHYRAGLTRYQERDLSDEEVAFVEAKLNRGPPVARTEKGED